jgi:hypothetical protein
MSTAAANHEKNSAALNSVVAAFLLTGLKVLVGVLSGSLGILAEAAHSGLDLAAAIVTCVAVRAASKPADQEHAYGHGKVENLSALVETLLLLATCVWIIRKSVLRLASQHVEVDASIWAFAVMGISIAVDFSRSRMLYRVAAKHRSQALEADALHFSTDIWSSAVVILGLAGVKLAQWRPELRLFAYADAVARAGGLPLPIPCGDPSLAGEYLAKLLKGKGRVVMLRYEEGSASTAAREKGFLAAMRRYPRIKVVSANQYGGATTESAYKASENLLAPYKKADGTLSIDGIFACNESTTFGMLRALQVVDYLVGEVRAGR